MAIEPYEYTKVAVANLLDLKDHHTLKAQNSSFKGVNFMAYELISIKTKHLKYTLQGWVKACLGPPAWSRAQSQLAQACPEHKSSTEGAVDCHSHLLNVCPSPKPSSPALEMPSESPPSLGEPGHCATLPLQPTAMHMPT